MRGLPEDRRPERSDHIEAALHLGFAELPSTLLADADQPLQVGPVQGQCRLVRRHDLAAFGLHDQRDRGFAEEGAVLLLRGDEVLAQAEVGEGDREDARDRRDRAVAPGDGLDRAAEPDRDEALEPVADPDGQGRIGGEPTALCELERGGPDATRDHRLQVRTLAGEESPHRGHLADRDLGEVIDQAPIHTDVPDVHEPIVGAEEPVGTTVRAEERHHLLEGGLGEAGKARRHVGEQRQRRQRGLLLVGPPFGGEDLLEALDEARVLQVDGDESRSLQEQLGGHVGRRSLAVSEADAADHRAVDAEADDGDRRDARRPSLGAHLGVQGRTLDVEDERLTGIAHGRKQRARAREHAAQVAQERLPQAEAGGDLELAVALEEDQSGRCGRGAAEDLERPDGDVARAAGRAGHGAECTKGGKVVEQPGGWSRGVLGCRGVVRPGLVDHGGRSADRGGEPVRAGVAHEPPSWRAYRTRAPRPDRRGPSRSRSLARSIATAAYLRLTRRQSGPR